MSPPNDGRSCPLPDRASRRGSATGFDFDAIPQPPRAARALALEVTVPADGLIAVVKRDCPTCELTASVLARLSGAIGLTVFTQDDPGFPEAVAARVDDTALNVSHTLGIEIVPTLIRRVAGQETARTYG